MLVVKHVEVSDIIWYSSNLYQQPCHSSLINFFPRGSAGLLPGTHAQASLRVTFPISKLQVPLSPIHETSQQPKSSRFLAVSPQIPVKSWYKSGKITLKKWHPPPGFFLKFSSPSTSHPFYPCALAVSRLCTGPTFLVNGSTCRSKGSTSASCCGSLLKKRSFSFVGKAESRET